MDYFELWLDDYACILDTMVSNYLSDLKAGRDPAGECMLNQWQQIERYRLNMEFTLARLRGMSPKDRSRWCKIEAKKRGVVS